MGRRGTARSSRACCRRPGRRRRWQPGPSGATGQKGSLPSQALAGSAGREQPQHRRYRRCAGARHATARNDHPGRAHLEKGGSCVLHRAHPVSDGMFLPGSG
ncbi:hypothetical protein J4711_14015 [Staphylococcus epidermidis]|nr:hypothetical protein [Staphylococcus epidermidis]